MRKHLCVQRGQQGRSAQPSDKFSLCIFIVVCEEWNITVRFLYVPSKEKFIADVVSKD